MSDEERAVELAGGIGSECLWGDEWADFGMHYDVVLARIQKAFAAIRADERERCAQVAEAEKAHFSSLEYSVDQPLGSISERVACDAIAAAIRSRKD